MSDELADALNEPASLASLAAQLAALNLRVTRIETRIIRWGAFIVLGAEAARMFISPMLGLT